jgi:hypothetical protein
VALADALSGLYELGRKEIENIGAWVVNRQDFLRDATRGA